MRVISAPWFLVSVFTGVGFPGAFVNPYPASLGTDSIPLKAGIQDARDPFR